MQLYKITATRGTHYEFDILANSEEEAIEEMNRIDLAGQAEEYSYHLMHFPLEITDIDKEESK